jgi:hypothetical protein
VTISRPGRVGLAALVSIIVAGALAPAIADAKTEELTFFSDPIVARPYTHENVTVTLEPEQGQAPDRPGYVTQFLEQVLVDRKDPKARPIPVNKVMVHHFLYRAPDRVQNGPVGCWGRGGFFGGRGEEHPTGISRRNTFPGKESPYGIHNITADGRAPTWYLNAMVMNHFNEPKRLYVKTTIRYVTGEKRIPVIPYTLGDCRHLAKAMSYDVPGGGKPGSTFTTRSDTTFPADWSGRIVLAHSHHHGGAKFQSLRSKTCDRPLLRARAYHGTPDHVYNTLRPILHEPGPIANDTFVSREGIPIGKGETLTRAAHHDNQYPHVAAMGFWAVWLVEDDSVGQCDPLPKDIRTVSRPKRFARKPPFWRGQVPQNVAPPKSPLQRYAGGALLVGDGVYTPARVEARVGQPITWNFNGSEPHSVTVANGPRGFSSIYWGQQRGSFTYTPDTPGTYKLYCYVHPLTMSSTLVVR